MRTRAFVVSIVVLVAAGPVFLSRLSSSDESQHIYIDRELVYPIVESSKECPVSMGHKGIVPDLEYLCCASLFWHGRGPVYVTFAWSDSDQRGAKFGLSRVPVVEGVYQVKTPWVIDSGYEGPVLIRGIDVDRKSQLDIFHPSDVDGGESFMAWNTSTRADKSRWVFRPTYLSLLGPGCYAVQIDTRDSTDIVVFEVFE